MEKQPPIVINHIVKAMFLIIIGFILLSNGISGEMQNSTTNIFPSEISFAFGIISLVFLVISILDSISKFKYELERKK